MRQWTFATLIAGSLAIAACSSETSGTFEGEDGEKGEYTIDRDTGEMNATIDTEDGTATIQSGTDVAVDLPEGFSVYPGATVVQNTVVKQDAGGGTLVTMSSTDSAEDIAAFYKAQAEKAGIEIQMDMTTQGGKMIGGESPDGTTLSVIASAQGEETIIQLAVGNE